MKIRKKSGQYFDTEQSRDEFGRFKKVEEESVSPGTVTPNPELSALLEESKKGFELNIDEMFDEMFAGTMEALQDIIDRK